MLPQQPCAVTTPLPEAHVTPLPEAHVTCCPAPLCQLGPGESAHDDPEGAARGRYGAQSSGHVGLSVISNRYSVLATEDFHLQ